jgi:hypothetical protein
MPPLRPRPSDFRASFVAIGWGGIEAHYGANSRTIARWIDEEGRDGLTAERAAHVAQVRADYRTFRDQCARPGEPGPGPGPGAARLKGSATTNMTERQALA